MASPALAHPTLQASYAHCQGVTKREAKNFYFAFLSLPAARRRAISAVYAFSRQCDDYSDEENDTPSKLELLESYRRQLHACFAGAPAGPVFTALHDVVNNYRIPQEYFDDLITGVQMDLTTSRYPTFDDLYTYCYRVASVVGLICIEIFGYSDARARELAIDLGIAMQLVNIMRDIKEDAARDRVYLPINELAEFGYAEADLFSETLNQPFSDLMRFQANRAREYFQRGHRLLPMVTSSCRPCPAILGGLYSSLLDRIEARGWDVFSERVRLKTRRKLWLAGKIWTETRLKGAPSL